MNGIGNFFKKIGGVFIVMFLFISLSYGIDISSCSELQNMADDIDDGGSATYPMSGNYDLVSDIDCSGVSDFNEIGKGYRYWDSGKGDYQFSGTYFRGNFNGNGYTISNINNTCNDSMLTNCGGLFSYVTGGSTIDNININGINLVVSGTIDPDGGYQGYNKIGGLVGTIKSSKHNTNITISNLNISSINIKCGHKDDCSDVGGIVGESYGNNNKYNIIKNINIGELNVTPDSFKKINNSPESDIRIYDIAGISSRSSYTNITEIKINNIYYIYNGGIGGIVNIFNNSGTINNVQINNFKIDRNIDSLVREGSVGGIIGTVRTPYSNSIELYNSYINTFTGNDYNRDFHYGSKNIGGLIGIIDADDSNGSSEVDHMIKNSFVGDYNIKSYKSLTGSIGGLIGNIYYSENDSWTNSGTITLLKNSYVINGNVNYTGSIMNTGGLLGNIYSTETIIYSGDNQHSIEQFSNESKYNSSLYESDFYDETFDVYSAYSPYWDFTNIWTSNSNDFPKISITKEFDPTDKTYNESIKEDNILTGYADTVDGDGDNLSYLISHAPSSGNLSGFDNNTAYYEYIPDTNYNGTDSFEIEAEDSDGNVGYINVNIDIGSVNDAPEDKNVSKTIDEDTTLSGTLSTTDVDDNNLIYSKLDSPSSGSLNVSSNGDYTYEPNSNYNGTDNFVIEATDDGGKSGLIYVYIDINFINDEPTIVNEINNQSGYINDNFNLDFSGTFDDVDNENLTYTSSNISSITGIDLYGNSKVISGTLPDLSSDTTYSIDLEAKDGSGGNVIEYFDLTVISNQPPEDKNVSKTTDEDIALTGTLSTTDPDGDSLTYEIRSMPNSGDLIVESGGYFDYEPDINYNGTDNFQVNAYDGKSGTGIITVDLTISSINDYPFIKNGILNQSGYKNNNFSLDFSGTFDDVDNENLTYTSSNISSITGINLYGSSKVISGTLPDLSSDTTYSIDLEAKDGSGGNVIEYFDLTVINPNNDPEDKSINKEININTELSGQVSTTDADGETLTYEQGTYPNYGNLSVNSDGSYTYTPDTDFEGLDGFIINASDGNGGVGQITVNVYVGISSGIINDVNQTPLIKKTISDKTINEKDNFSLNLNNYFDNSTGNELVYDIFGEPSFLEFNGYKGILTGQSTIVTGNETYNITIEAENSLTTIGADKESIDQKFDLTIENINESPQNKITSFSVDEDNTFSDSINTIDNDDTNLSYNLIEREQKLKGDFELQDNGDFIYNPEKNYNGSGNIKVVAKDSYGEKGIITGTITVNPVNDKPIDKEIDKELKENTKLEDEIKINDPDNDELSFSINISPNNGSLVINSGNYVYTPNTDYYGSDYFEIKASDGNGGSGLLKVNLNVFKEDAPKSKTIDMDLMRLKER